MTLIAKILASFAVAAVSFRFLERPINRVGRAWLARRENLRKTLARPPAATGGVPALEPAP